MMQLTNSIFMVGLMITSDHLISHDVQQISENLAYIKIYFQNLEIPFHHCCNKLYRGGIIELSWQGYKNQIFQKSRDITKVDLYTQHHLVYRPYSTEIMITYSILMHICHQVDPSQTFLLTINFPLHISTFHFNIQVLLTHFETRAKYPI